MNIEEKRKKATRINNDKLKLLANDEDFLFDVKEYRKKIKIPINGYKQEKYVEKIYRNIEKIESINKATDNLIKKHKLTNNYKYNILIFLLYNKFIRIPMNYAINLEKEYLQVKIYKKPTKNEWSLIKNDVDNLINTINTNKKSKFLGKFNYPDGTKISRPKPKIDQTLKIIEASKNLGKESIEDDEKYIYTDKDIEAKIFDWSNTKRTKKNVQNIKTRRHRYKRKNKGDL